ncbi:MAG: M50 family metallopeptidase [Acidobacteria bacterium]|nr:M50 family metallopeptidase [Acidobacteriota bacterium]
MLLEGAGLLSLGLSDDLRTGAERYIQEYLSLLPQEDTKILLDYMEMIQRLFAAAGAIFVLCGFGALNNKTWGRWAGIFGSAFNILWFTPLGIAGLVAFFKPLPPSPDDDLDRASGNTEPTSHALIMIASIAIMLYLRKTLTAYSVQLGLPVDPEDGIPIVWLIGGQYVFILFHELGHLLAAWACGFRFQAMNVGPVTVMRSPGGSWRFGFDASKILLAGGFLQSVPSSTKDLKMNWIIVIVAGPAASLFFGLIGLLSLVSLPGTNYTEYWYIPVFVASICGSDFIANLLPLGLTDGALLAHTVFNTEKGKGILSSLSAAMLADRADRSVTTMAPDELLETRRQALDAVSKTKEVSPLEKACHQLEFGRAAIIAGRHTEAADALREAGKIIDSTPGLPPSVLFRYYLDTFEIESAANRVSSAVAARNKALELEENLGGSDLDWESMLGFRTECVILRIGDNDFHSARLRAESIRSLCPNKRPLAPQRAQLLALQAECWIRTGNRERGFEILEEAIDELLDTEGDKSLLALTMEVLGQTAIRMAGAQEIETAERLFHIAVPNLEKADAANRAAIYRAAWAEALYQFGRFADAQQIVAAIQTTQSKAFAREIESLKASLYLAEDKTGEAIQILQRLAHSVLDTDPIDAAGNRALLSWALYRAGSMEPAMAEARQACDMLMPTEHHDAAPALLTLALAVWQENPDLGNAYVDEATRLIEQTLALSPSEKGVRLSEMARRLAVAKKPQHAKDVMKVALQYRPPPAQSAS